MSRRADQVGRELHRHMALALTEVFQQGTRITITRVKATDDLRALRVWVQGWKNLDDRVKATIEYRFRGAIRSSSQTKFTPRLIVLNDDSVDYAEHIDKLLKEDQ
jgi:ribosome-binding factor A